MLRRDQADLLEVMFNQFVDQTDQLAEGRHWKKLVCTSRLRCTECMPNFWSTLEQHSHYYRRHCILAANGGELFVLGKTDLTLTIDDMVMHSNALVAQINADGILGLDFMLENSCSFDVSHNVLLLKDKRIPLLVEGDIGCNQITSIKTVSIPPRAELLTVGQVLKMTIVFQRVPVW